MEAKTPQETNSLNQKPNQPPSPLSSPSHEFSFTITLHPSPNSSPNTLIKRTKNSSSIALDLAPADEIFFHGHLLPLQLLSDPPISPRPSTDISIEDFSLNPPLHPPSHISFDENKRKKSSNSLSKISKWFEDKKKHFLKKYASMVEPLFFFKGEKSKQDLRRRPCSFSGNSNPKMRDKWMRRGEFSAPASMWTSPTNSGLLRATPTGCTSSCESSMEELQNAIQAAIAHCKNSTATTKDSVQVV